MAEETFKVGDVVLLQGATLLAMGGESAMTTSKEGLEFAARWHDEQERLFRERTAEAANGPAPNEDIVCVLDRMADFHRGCATAIRAIGDQDRQPPQGWAIVPIEPTDNMLNAAQSRLCEIENITYFDDYNQAEMFKAMVLASPPPPQPLSGNAALIWAAAEFLSCASLHKLTVPGHGRMKREEVAEALRAVQVTVSQPASPPQEG